MRLAGLRSLLFLVFSVAIVGTFSGCDNPFDPLKSSDKIQGLTFFDFSATQERWDSDPEWDGLQITMSYYNEFGDSLDFHDKPHKIQIDFYTEVVTDPGPPEVTTWIFRTSKTVEFSNSDDFIRIPIEFYGGLIGIDSSTLADIKGCLQLRVFPPQEYPKKELVSPVACDVTFYTFEETL